MQPRRSSLARWRAHLLALALGGLALATAACGGGGTAAQHPAPAPAPAAPAAAQPAPPPAGEAPLTDAECDQLADHLVELSLADPRTPRAAEYTAQDADNAKRELRGSMRPACAQLGRAALRCALAAKTAETLAACE